MNRAPWFGMERWPHWASNGICDLSIFQGPEGRSPNVSPARQGWEINPEDGSSAVGAALNFRAVPSGLGGLARACSTHAPPHRCRQYSADADPSWRYCGSLLDRRGGALVDCSTPGAANGPPERGRTFGAFSKVGAIAMPVALLLSLGAAVLVQMLQTL
jgi:hypothetical protein